MTSPTRLKWPLKRELPLNDVATVEARIRTRVIERLFAQRARSPRTLAWAVSFAVCLVALILGWWGSSLLRSEADSGPLLLQAGAPFDTLTTQPAEAPRRARVVGGGFGGGAAASASRLPER